MSVELYNQHTAISELQQVEDEMIDQLKLMAEFSSKFVPELMDLCRMTNDPDYDQDGEFESFSIFERFSNLKLIFQPFANVAKSFSVNSHSTRNLARTFWMSTSRNWRKKR